MSKSYLQFVLGLIFSILLSRYEIKACTAFVINDDKQLVLAKNLDWPINDGLIIINKRGVVKEAFINSKNRYSWVSKYGSITFNQFGKEFPLGGINEKGLVIEELNNWGEVSESGSIILNEFQFVQYILDNYTTIEELRENKDNIFVKPLFINLHYLISDKQGKIAIIEYYNNKMFFYEGADIVYPVLSNNHYSNSLKYIQNFQGFGGDVPVPSTNTSNDRFVKISLLLKEKPLKNKIDNVSYAFQGLDLVRQSDTQWSIVYDIHNLAIHFLISGGIKKKIELSDFDFSCNTPVLCYNIGLSYKEKREVYFEEYTGEQNKDLLLNVFNLYNYYELGNVDKEIFVQLYRFGNNIKCTK